MSRPFRLTPPIPSERELHIATARMLDALLLPPAVWFTYAAGASILSPQQAARHYEIGMKRGLPDIWLICGGVYCIELKRPKTGALSKTRVVSGKHGKRLVEGQAEMFPRLIAAGVKEIRICRTIEDVLNCLREWQIPLRRHQAVASSSMTSAPGPTPSRCSSTPTTRRRRSPTSRSTAML